MDRGLVDVGCRPLAGGVPVLIQVQWPPHRPPQIESVVKAPRCRTQTQQERRRRTLPAYGARGRRNSESDVIDSVRLRVGITAAVAFLIGPSGLLATVRMEAWPCDLAHSGGSN